MSKLLLLLLVSSLISFANNGVEVIKSTSDELILSFNPLLKGFDKIETDEKNISYYPKFDGAVPKGEIAGEPYHFVVPALVSVPSENGYEIELLSSPEYESVDNLLAPVPTEKNIDGTSIDFITSPNYFEVENPPFIKSEFLGRSSGQNILKLEFLAAHYNSDIQKTAITKRILVKIKFDDSNSTTKIKRSNTGLTLNHDIATKWDVSNKIKNKRNFKLQNISSGDWIRVKVRDKGLYRITKDNLTALGYDLNSIDPSTIKVFGYGGIPLDESVENDDWQNMPENEIVVRNDNNGNFQELIFYANGIKGFKPNARGAENYVNWYDNDNYYMLTWGGTQGKRASNKEFSGNITNNPTSYKHHTYFGEDLINLDPSGSGRQMVGNLITDNEIYETKLHNLIKSDTITYRIAAAHKSIENADLNIYENGAEIGSIRMVDVPARGYQYADRPTRYFSVPASSISGDQSRLSFEYIGSNTESPFLDYYEIHYPRELKAIDNEITIFSDFRLQGGTSYKLSGFSGNVYLIDATDPKNPVFLNNYGSASNPEIRFDADQVRKFYVSGKTKTPELEKANFSNLRADHLNTDLIVITDEELLNSATKFKEYRESHSNLKVSVVTTESIYNEFGAGVKDITAIRNFLQHAYNSWEVTPSYVLFWGDAHSDNRNISIKEKIYVPLYHSADSSRTMSGTNTTAHDDYFLRVDGEDRLIELISGRVPLHSMNGKTADEVGEMYVQKIDNYENHSDVSNWRTNITLVADDGLQSNGRNDGNTHISASEYLTDIEQLNNFIHNKIYLIEYQTEFTSDGRRKPNANTDINNAINDGSLVLNWSGHGNPYVWAHENVFNQGESLDRLNNKDRLFFATAATCSFGQFDSYNGTIASEDLLLMEEGGAIGLFAATRLVYAIANGNMNELYFEKLTTRDPETGLYPSIGQALYQVKQILDGDNDEKYLILGDPTIKLLIPNYKVVIDSFPQTDLPENPDSPIVLKGLSKVKVMGHIEKPAGGFADDFSGDLEFSVFDGDRSFEIEELGEFYFFRKYGGILNKSTTKVENGNFELDFIIPKDISFSDNLGRMFAFARSSDSTKFAKGNFNEFRVYGIDNNSFSDTEGPQINIYLDSRKFQEGDVVSNEPLLIVDLFDNLGINSTGVGIGHRIEAWVNDNPNPIDMTGNYSTLNGSNREGTSNVQLKNLQPGLNKVVVRAWDLFNNFAIAETYFYISEIDNKIYITDIINYPNPFTDRTTIQFKHNLEPGFDYYINIYNIEGQLIRNFEGRSFDRQVLEVDWDGTTNSGEAIFSGSYLIQVNVRSIDGFEKNGAGIISFKVN